MYNLYVYLHIYIYSKLDKKILMHKDDLWWYWEHVDPDGTGKVPLPSHTYDSRAKS